MRPPANGSYFPCPHCGTLNAVTRDYCRKCRKPI